ncbi:hypothetical protein ACJU4I_10805 [Pseudomonas aeruginosa]|uniref:hypothetical protein n=1 Tax=Pseudomonas aeruginosa TaxID=287 RepID=UPI0038837950
MTDLNKLKELSPLEKACSEIKAVREEREREEQEQKSRWRSLELSAVRTLEALGYTYHGGEQWKPPIGKAPDFDLIDSLRAEVERLRADTSSMRGSLNAYSKSTKKLVKDGTRAAKERDRLKAENEELRGALQAVVDDPTWRNNDNTLWPKIIKAMDKGAKQ